MPSGRRSDERSPATNDVDDARVSALAFDAVSAVAAGTRLFDNLDLVVEPGERVAIVAASGTGKSLLSALALGLARPLSGAARLFNVDLADAAPDDLRTLRSRCGVTMQGGSLLTQLTVEQNLWLALGTGGASRLRRRIDRLLLDFAIERSGSVAVAALSRGERRRVELARAFVRDPEFVILDEPLDGAAAHADEIERAIVRQTRARGRTMLLLTQDAALASRLAERVLRLDRGRLHQVEAAAA